MYRFERVLTDAQSNARHAALLAEVFQKPQLFSSDFISWQYDANPAGKIVGFNALADGSENIAAHYVTQPFAALIYGSIEKGLLSLNTATHADHRGKGLFPKLAERTYDDAAREGFGFVIGVANQNSVHGFTSKLGFQLVGQLDAKIGLGAVPVSLTKHNYDRLWDPAALKWRTANPSARYFGNNDSTLRVFSATHLPFIKAALITAPAAPVELERAPGFNPLTLYIGRDRSLSFAGKAFFEIPKRFRPAPLFLIFRDLSGKNRKLDFDDLRFRLIDFDAY